VLSLSIQSIRNIPDRPLPPRGNQIFEGVVNSINTLKMFTESLITRVKTINNDMIKLDTSVSAALELTPDLDRIARAENFVEDGSIDVRRD